MIEDSPRNGQPSSSEGGSVDKYEGGNNSSAKKDDTTKVSRCDEEEKIGGKKNVPVSSLLGTSGGVNVSSSNSGDDEGDSHGDGSPVEGDPSSDSIEGEDGDEDAGGTGRREGQLSAVKVARKATCTHENM